MEKLMNSKKGKTAVLLALTILYFAGIVCLFFNVGLGILLWGAALIPSLVIFLWQKHQEQLEKERKLEAESRENKG